MIDWNRVSELREEVGEDNFDEVIDLFLFEVEDELARLRHCRDAETLAARLHFLKGSALNLGFAAFSDLCQAGETAAGKSAEPETDTDAILTCYDQSKQAFVRGLHRFAAA
ncbi:MAG: Hpt domain-containing protein [Roseovarius sp.]|uniref:Hpt domain-containing protein n=1 Tax=Roseovarius sp. TaxID=1486281 RepID=UPI0032ED9576